MIFSDLAGRWSNRVQLTIDGHKPYLEAVETAFGSEIDCAMLVKIYGKPQDEIRDSPAECTGCETKWIAGRPNPKGISTSYIERQDLTMLALRTDFGKYRTSLLCFLHP